MHRAGHTETERQLAEEGERGRVETRGWKTCIRDNKNTCVGSRKGHGNDYRGHQKRVETCVAVRFTCNFCLREVSSAKTVRMSFTSRVFAAVAGSPRKALLNAALAVDWGPDMYQ